MSAREACRVGAGGAVLAACSSPNPVLYTIAPVQGPVQTGGPKVIVLQQICHRALPGALADRSLVGELSARRDVERLVGRAASAMLSRVLVEELGQRLPQSTVIGENGAVSASPDATIELNVQRLDEDAAGNLVLQAQASVSFKGRPAPVLRSFRFVVTPPAAGIPGEVAAISTAVGQLADGLASMLVGR